MNGTGNHSQLGSDFGPPQDSIQPASLQVDTSQPQSRGKRKLKPYVRNAGGITEAEMVEYDTHLNRGDNRPQLIEDDPDYGKNPGKAKRRRVAGGTTTASKSRKKRPEAAPTPAPTISGPVDEGAGHVFVGGLPPESASWALGDVPHSLGIDPSPALDDVDEPLARTNTHTDVPINFHDGSFTPVSSIVGLSSSLASLGQYTFGNPSAPAQNNGSGLANDRYQMPESSDLLSSGPWLAAQDEDSSFTAVHEPHPQFYHPPLQSSRTSAQASGSFEPGFGESAVGTSAPYFGHHRSHSNTSSIFSEDFNVDRDGSTSSGSPGSHSFGLPYGSSNVGTQPSVLPSSSSILHATSTAAPSIATPPVSSRGTPTPVPPAPRFVLPPPVSVVASNRMSKKNGKPALPSRTPRASSVGNSGLAIPAGIANIQAPSRPMVAPIRLGHYNGIQQTALKRLKTEYTALVYTQAPFPSRVEEVRLSNEAWRNVSALFPPSLGIELTDAIRTMMWNNPANSRSRYKTQAVITAQTCFSVGGGGRTPADNQLNATNALLQSNFVYQDCSTKPRTGLFRNPAIADVLVNNYFKDSKAEGAVVIKHFIPLMPPTVIAMVCAVLENTLDGFVETGVEKRIDFSAALYSASVAKYMQAWNKRFEEDSVYAEETQRLLAAEVAARVGVGAAGIVQKGKNASFLSDDEEPGNSGSESGQGELEGANGGEYQDW